MVIQPTHPASARCTCHRVEASDPDLDSSPKLEPRSNRHIITAARKRYAAWNLTMNVILLVLLVFSLIFAWLRLMRPFDMRAGGNSLLTISLPLLARMRMHALPAIVGIAIALLLVLVYHLPVWIAGLPVLSFGLLSGIPTRYALTDHGIRLGWTPFRRWTEFAGVTRARGRARLQGVHGSRSMRIWLSGSRGDDEFLHLLKNFIKNGYKGENTTHIVSFATSDHLGEDGTILTI